MQMFHFTRRLRPSNSSLPRIPEAKRILRYSIQCIWEWELHGDGLIYAYLFQQEWSFEVVKRIGYLHGFWLGVCVRTGTHVARSTMSNLH